MYSQRATVKKGKSGSFRGRLHVRFWVKKLLYDSVNDFLLKVVGNLIFNRFFPEMCLQSVVSGVQRIIKTLKPLYANRARNRTEICTQNGTCVDGPERRAVYPK
jgi:hypothetical protein